MRRNMPSALTQPVLTAMTSSAKPSRFRPQAIVLLSLFILQLAFVGCAKKSPAQTTPSDLSVNITVPFRFIAYGDARFHDLTDFEAANPPVRAALVRSVAGAHPAFICFTGDIVYRGSDLDDWKVFDRETSIWRDEKIPVFPALGNHEFYGNEKTALANYFQRFPDLKDSRYYSVRAANTLILVLDSSLDEASGPQGEWLKGKLDRLPANVDFVFLMLHHPPYTDSEPGMFGEGHTARMPEKALAKLLEDREPHTRARFIVFSGHVHNYERREHGGVTYFVSGG